MENIKKSIDHVRREMTKEIFGQEIVIDQILCTMLAEGHCLLEGPPGVGKTSIARTLTQILNLSFSRVQFTPDLMPTDILGVSIIEPKSQTFIFKKGPIFSDIVLADELNRSPARTQAAMLEAMGERQISIDGNTYSLPAGFMVIATQNPFEYEGTYGLPEAQLDRFMMRIKVSYPTKEKARAMLTGNIGARMNEVVSKESFELMRLAVAKVLIDDKLLDYINDLIHLSRELPEIAIGASPRAALMLVKAAKSWALLQGRDFVIPEDVQVTASPVLAHRFRLSPDAEIEGMTAEKCLEKMFKKLVVPRS